MVAEEIPFVEIGCQIGRNLDALMLLMDSCKPYVSNF
jgi:hypothetical protein